MLRRDYAQHVFLWLYNREANMSRRARKQKCNKYRKQKQGDHLRVIQGGAPLERIRNKSVTITPRNFHQDDLIGLLENRKINIVFAVGPAGTGKTIISTLQGIKKLKAGHCNKFVVTRPAVSVDEQHGFLPGTLQEKMAPWTIPIFDVFKLYYTTNDIRNMLYEGIIEISPLAYMRGRTFHNSYIVADEMQNASVNQMKMLLTRIGKHSKLAVTGDLHQTDRPRDNGLSDFIHKLNETSSKYIDIVNFVKKDVLRNKAVQEVLDIYGD